MTTEMNTTATERVLAVLDGVRPEGKGWKALCPAHDDHSPSLSITPADDRVLLCCRAGCEYDAVLAAAGLRPSDLFDHPRTGGGGGGGGMQIGPDGELEWMPPGFTYQDYYNYVSPSGTLVFQVLRGRDDQGEKAFRQRRPNRSARSGWTWSLKDLPAIEREIPYLLPELIAAKDAGKTIWITEGEKDAEALGDTGVPTTCNAGGAGKWAAGHAAYLKGAAAVVIVADKDKPGYKHVALVAKTLRNVGVTDIRVVEAAATITNKGADAADHLAAGFGLDDFVDVLPEKMVQASESTEDKTASADPAGSGENQWYEATDTGLILVQRHKGEKGRTYTTSTRLTTFRAVITSSTEIDDGAEIERELEIEATVAGRVRRCSIPASAYARMEWVVPELGPQAIVLPQCKDQARAAIQTLSDPVETRQYSQTGWKTVDGQEVYLHAGGALGAEGPVEDVQVDLSGSLVDYLLPSGVGSRRSEPRYGCWTAHRTESCFPCWLRCTAPRSGSWTRRCPCSARAGSERPSWRRWPNSTMGPG